MTLEPTMSRAIGTGDAEMARKLVAADPAILKGYFLEDTWLHRAAMGGLTVIMEVLVDAGMPIDSLTKNGKRTPLSSAATQGRFQACVWLLDRGADVNFGLGKFATPIFAAIFSKSLDLVKLFVARGANLQASFGDPKIDLITYSEGYGSEEIVAYLRDVS